MYAFHQLMILFIIKDDMGLISGGAICNSRPKKTWMRLFCSKTPFSISQMKPEYISLCIYVDVEIWKVAGEL